MTRRTATPRGGFTMIELLVVILIIAILASLLTVAITRVQAAAKRAAAAAEMAQISNGIGAFKAKMNVGYVPSGGGGANGAFRLCSTYVDGTGAALQWPEVIMLKQIFPAMSLADNGLRVGGTPVGNGVVTPTGGIPMIELDANQTMVFFLTGGKFLDYQGFSSNRQQPFEATATTRTGPFLDFQSNKYALAGTPAVLASLLDPWGSPYAYFSFNGAVNGYNLAQTYTFNGTTVQPYVDDKNRPLNPKGFQLISAGENGGDDSAPKGFGRGGNTWVPQQGEYAEGAAGADDLGSFNGNSPLIIRN